MSSVSSRFSFAAAVVAQDAGVVAPELSVVVIVVVAVVLHARFSDVLRLSFARRTLWPTQ
jgi:hypothetical protein